MGKLKRRGKRFFVTLILNHRMYARMENVIKNENLLAMNLIRKLSVAFVAGTHKISFQTKQKFGRADFKNGRSESTFKIYKYKYIFDRQPGGCNYWYWYCLRLCFPPVFDKCVLRLLDNSNIWLKSNKTIQRCVECLLTLIENIYVHL